MIRTYYLAYGMNTNTQSMAMRCPSAISLGTVKLKDHKLAFKYHCDVVKSRGNRVECVLWSITPDCEQSLDRLEGFPEYYLKKEVAVKHNGKNVRAMIYYMATKEDIDYPSEFYLNMVAEGYQEHNIAIEQLEEALEEIDKQTIGDYV